MRRLLWLFICVLFVVFACGGDMSQQADAGVKQGGLIPDHGHSGPNDGGILATNATIVTDSTGTTVGASAGVFIAYDTEIRDSLNTHSNVTNNTRVTVPSGYSYVKAICWLAINSVASETNRANTMYIMKNRTTTYSPITLSSWSANAGAGISVAFIPVVANDYLECRYNNYDTVSGDSIQAGSTFSVEFLK